MIMYTLIDCHRPKDHVIDCMCTCALSKSIHALTGEFGIVYKGYIGKDSALDIAAIKTLKGIDHYNLCNALFSKRTCIINYYSYHGT